MRLWSIHPGQLDRVALVAVWREGLLAKKVLEGNTKGYTNHPQLERFKACVDPLVAINVYLHAIADEADARGYTFDRSKLSPRAFCEQLPLTDGQLKYEWQHLLRKSAQRSADHYKVISVQQPRCHPLLALRNGAIENWEKL